MWFLFFWLFFNFNQYTKTELMSYVVECRNFVNLFLLFLVLVVMVVVDLYYFQQVQGQEHWIVLTYQYFYHVGYICSVYLVCMFDYSMVMYIVRVDVSSDSLYANSTNSMVVRSGINDYYLLLLSFIFIFVCYVICWVCFFLFFVMYIYLNNLIYTYTYTYA